jgi:RNA polymerase sigma factor (sigma-70 family)
MSTHLPVLARHIADPANRLPDGACLQRFVEHRDEEAFAELVRRNGPLVLRAIRSVLRDPAAADDAFQTVFLQLARRATGLTASRSLAGWLHTTAVRTAGSIRRAEARRRRHEHLAQSVRITQPPADPTWLEVREVIDAELARLPEKYRLPLLLCYIEGLTYSEAAARLGCSSGALHGRLERGRRWLQRRLEARGLPAVALTLGAGTLPAVSAELRERTVSAVSGMGPRPAALTVWGTLAPTRRVFLTGCVAVVAIGIGLGAVLDSADPPKDPSPAVPSAPTDGNSQVPSSPRDVLGDPLPKGALARLGTTRFLQYSRDVMISPDGKLLAVSDVAGESLTLMDAVTGQVLRHQALIGVGGDYTFPGKEGGFTTPGIFWRPDGRGVALVGQYPWDKYLWDFTDPKDVPPTFEPRSNDVLPPEPPEGAVSCAAVSADGKWLAIARQPSKLDRRVVQVFPCQTGKSIRDLKADRTLGPFSAACERIWFAANGRELILARADRTVVAIDATTGKELRRVALPKWAVIASSPDGKFVAIVPRSAERDVWHTGEETVRVWELITGKEVWKFPRPGTSISGLAFTPDSKHLITSDNEFDFRKWDLASGKEAARHQLPSVIDSMTAVTISADGKRIATARSGTAITVRDAATGVHLNSLATHQDAVAGVAISPDSRHIATVGADETLRIWQTASGKQVCTIPAARTSASRAYCVRRTVSFTPDGRGVVFEAAGVLALADPTTGKALDLPGGLNHLTGAVGGFSADGKTLVTFSGDTTTLWDWPAGSSRQTFRASLEEQRLWGPPPKTPQMPVTVSATLAPDGRTLLCVSNQQSGPGDVWGGPNSNDLWDIKSGKRRYRLAPDLWYPQVVFSPDGRTLYAGGHASDPEGKHGRVRRDGLASWDVATGTIVRRFDDPLYNPNAGPRDPGRRVRALALSPDGRLLAVAEGDFAPSIWIHETASGRVVRRFDGHSDFIYGLAFTPDGSKLVSASHDHTGLVWDIALRTFSARKAAALTPGERADSWDRLAAADPVLAWRALADLAGSPTEAVALLSERLKAPPVPTAADLDRIEKQLDAPDFEDREKASAELDAFGPNAVAMVKSRIKTTESAEVARRFGEFLKRHSGERASPLVLRGLRGVAVLEAIGSPEARKVLVRLAGNRGEPLGNEAADALARLERLGNRK